MNQETYDSLEPKPKKWKGQNITLVQVTNKSSITEFVTLPLTFDTKDGPIEMTVEAYIVPKMNTPFILGTDFASQYKLSIQQTKVLEFSSENQDDISI